MVDVQAPNDSLPLTRPQNRWTRPGDWKKKPVAEAPISPRTQSAVVAIQVLLPQHPQQLICRVVTECGGDADIALEKLLATAEKAACEAPSAPAAPPLVETPVEAKPVRPSAPAELPLEQAHVPKPSPVEEPAMSAPSSSSSSWTPVPEASSSQAHAEQSSAAPQEEVEDDVEPGGWTVVDAVHDRKPEPPLQAKLEPKPDAPSWLPLLRSGGKDPSSSKPTFYDVQTDRLKAALGAVHTAPAVGATANDLHGAGKGSGRKGGG